MSQKEEFINQIPEIKIEKYKNGYKEGEFELDENGIWFYEFDREGEPIHDIEIRLSTPLIIKDCRRKDGNLTIFFKVFDGEKIHNFEYYRKDLMNHSKLFRILLNLGQDIPVPGSKRIGYLKFFLIEWSYRVDRGLKSDE